ncbi:MAG: site-specific DNA-methyltransferase [Alphaproteobacteria bacterium GM202ARS2]|nr:site-specific DNA-methyltransferase [Alphaproteobacteria bacterium GM202ARS2]
MNSLMSMTHPRPRRSFGLHHGKKVYEGYNAERKVRNRKKKEKKREGYHAFAREFPTTNTPLPERFTNTILCGDSLSLLQQLPNQCIDAIITSPPYNFGLEYGTHQDTDTWQQYYAQLFAILKECVRVLAYGGRLMLNVQPLFSDYIPSHHLISHFLFQQGLIWKGEILWEKNNYNCKYTAWGSWQSPSSPYLKYTWEFIEVFCKGALKKDGNKNAIDITADEFKAWVNAKWSIAPERDMHTYNHPAMFPKKLVERLLKLFTYQQDVVLDPFNGAGTTTLVAYQQHRRYLGIDIDAGYCATARERLKI